jgi:DNA-binding NarL/FixJ family response regulator
LPGGDRRHGYRPGSTGAGSAAVRAAEGLFARIGSAIWPVDKIDHDRYLAAARERLGADGFAAAFAEGQTLSLERAIAAAITVGDELVAPGRADRTDARFPVTLDAFGLSPRERDVLRLVARRATDREIADELSISPRTVMHHVSSILAKLGVANRREAAALASSLDLD